MLSRFKRILSILGPGIFAIGYTIGTGSVTSMAKAGSQYGLQLVWVLFLSCLFSGLLLNAGLALAFLFSCIIAVTGALALYGQFAA